jgi:acyl-CoA thioesterase-1
VIVGATECRYLRDDVSRQGVEVVARGAVERNRAFDLARDDPDVRIVLVGMQAPPNLGEDYGRGFRAIFPEVAREKGLTLVPFLLEGVGGVDSLNQEDAIHPNEEGQKVLAETVWKTLEPVLREEDRRRAER